MELSHVLHVVSEYTDQQRIVLDNIRHGNLLGRLVNFTPEGIRRLSTPEGINQQLAEFILPEGIVYYVAFDDDQPVLKTVCISKKGIS